MNTLPSIPNEPSSTQWYHVVAIVAAGLWVRKYREPLKAFFEAFFEEMGLTQLGRAIQGFFQEIGRYISDFMDLFDKRCWVVVLMGILFFSFFSMRLYLCWRQVSGPRKR